MRGKERKAGDRGRWYGCREIKQRLSRGVGGWLGDGGWREGGKDMEEERTRQRRGGEEERSIEEGKCNKLKANNNIERIQSIKEHKRRMEYTRPTVTVF